MPRLIVLNGTGPSVTYTLGGIDELRLESVSADIDTTAAGGTSFADVIYRDAAGFLLARSRSSNSLLAGSLQEMTWAPDLPDSILLNNIGLSDVLTTGLADTLIPPRGTVTVTVSDAAAIVRQARLWVDSALRDATSSVDEALVALPWAFVPGPGA